MKPAANSQAPPSSTAGNQTVTYDNLNSQPDFGELPWEPYYSQKIPEGAGVPAKLPADSSNESAQTAGRRLICCLSLRDTLYLSELGLSALMRLSR